MSKIEYRVVTGYVGNPTNDTQFSDKLSAYAEDQFYVQKLSAVSIPGGTALAVAVLSKITD